MKTIKELLPLCKGNASVYYNLDSKTVADFQKRYNDLKKYQSKEVSDFIVMLFDNAINDENEPMRFLRKLEAMKILRGTV